MKSYKVTAKFGNDTIKFILPIGCRQETLNEAHQSARKLATEAFNLDTVMTLPETLKVMIEEYYED